MNSQEPKMSDRFGAPLYVGDRVVWVSPPATELVVLLGTVTGWLETLAGSGLLVEFADRSWVFVLRESKDRLVRWCHGS